MTLTLKQYRNVQLQDNYTMEISQVKLTKKEWASVEVPVSESEKEILRMIQDGFENVSIKYNPHKSLFTVLKINPTPEMEYYLYTQYFEEEVKSICKLLHDTSFALEDKAMKTKMPKKADILRLNNLGNIHQNEKQRDCIYEFVLLRICKTAAKDIPFCVYTLHHLLTASVSNINTYVTKFCKFVYDKYTTNNETICGDIVRNSYRVIEKNSNLLTYADQVLYDHQKQLFQVFREPTTNGKLVLYTAPTGTGKTLSPLGLSSKYRIIYICAARHIGLALAKSAISMEKAVAFAFGCETASDIRLHYYAAVDYTRNKKSGGIQKVDNSNGTKVEIMICDVASYLVAMYYMLSFNQEEDIIMYWDEPTISLDVETHDLHDTIHKLWMENKLSKVVLSSATLPKEADMMEMIDDFRDRFENTEVHSITSYDCKKTVRMLDQKGECVVPHLLFTDHKQIVDCARHLRENKTILKYLDLREILSFVEYVESTNSVSDAFHVNNYFTRVEQIELLSVKEYYMELLQRIDPSKWHSIHMLVSSMKHSIKDGYGASSGLRKIVSVEDQQASMQNLKAKDTGLTRLQSIASTSVKMPEPQKPVSSGVLLTTEDAHSLTDGPTIFLVEDVQKLGKFYIQQSKIPKAVMEHLMEKIGLNNQIQKKMEVLMKALDDAIGTESEKEKKMEKESFKPEARKLMNAVEALRSEIAVVTMEPMYVPNTRQHQNVWLKNGQVVENAFVPYIEDATVKEIMELDVDTNMKMLLLLGIGIFVNSKEQDDPSKVAYTEIMKRLSQEQKLYLIIAYSDYIYGTNYQLCHAFLGKDLLNMSQQKIIQAMGRVGRRNIQQEYTVRFRDDSLLSRLLLPTDNTENIEAINICKLLVRH